MCDGIGGKNAYVRLACAIEHMITDALLAADSYLKLSDAIDHPEEYMQLTDHVLRSIEFSKNDVG